MKMNITRTHTLTQIGLISQCYWNVLMPYHVLIFISFGNHPFQYDIETSTCDAIQERVQ